MILAYETGKSVGEQIANVSGDFLGQAVLSPNFQKSIEGVVVASLDSPAVQKALTRATRPILAQAALWIGGSVFLAVLLARR